MTGLFGDVARPGPEDGRPQSRRAMDGLGVPLDDFGGSIVIDPHTTLAAARRS